MTDEDTQQWKDNFKEELSNKLKGTREEIIEYYLEKFPSLPVDKKPITCQIIGFEFARRDAEDLKKSLDGITAVHNDLRNLYQLAIKANEEASKTNTKLSLTMIVIVFLQLVVAFIQILKI